jgi:hypothetical protein
MSTDKLTTYLGLAQSVGVAAVTFYTTSAQGAINLSDPMFWVGMGVAVLMAVKGYFTNKTEVKP